MFDKKDYESNKIPKTTPVTSVPTPIHAGEEYYTQMVRKKEALSEMNISPVKKTLMLKNSRSALGTTLVSSAMKEIMGKSRNRSS